jgi:peroxiredoxin
MMKLKKNDNIPNSEVFIMVSGNPVKKHTAEFFKDKKVVLFGLPGAFTSVCSAKHLPGYLETYEKYKKKGIDYIVCISVNDPFVMDAWGKNHDVGDKIVMMADPFLNFTKLIGADVDKSARGLGIRSNRYTMLIDNLKVLVLQEEEDAGTCEVSAAKNFLNLV